MNRKQLVGRTCVRAICKVLLCLTAEKVDFYVAGGKVSVHSASVCANKF